MAKEGINSLETSSKEQEEEKVRIYNLQQKQRYNERMIRKYTRLELASTDNDNREYYKSKKRNDFKIRKFKIK